MALSPELWFAYRFPFSETARGVVRATSVDWNALPADLVHASYRGLLAAFGSSSRESDVAPPAETAQVAVQSFALSKILLSYGGEPAWFDAFARRLRDRTLFFLQADPKPEALALQLLLDMGIPFERTNDGGYSVSVSIFLSVATNDEHTRLVNLRIEKGRVLLSLNHLQRWLAQFAYAKTLAALPVETSGFPASLEKLGREVARRLKSHRQQLLAADAPALLGPVRADAFPPCMSDLFTRLSSGENLPHMARFDLATFLVAIHMPADSVVNAFARAPNYSEKITRYQVERIQKLKLSAPSCAKVREHGYCPLSSCTVKHPVSYYSKAVSRAPAPEKDENASSDA